LVCNLLDHGVAFVRHDAPRTPPTLVVRVRVAAHQPSTAVVEGPFEPVAELVVDDGLGEHSLRLEPDAERGAPPLGRLKPDVSDLFAKAVELAIGLVETIVHENESRANAETTKGLERLCRPHTLRENLPRTSRSREGRCVS